MLDLIVLGQIPGTHLQITFAWYLYAGLGLLAFTLHRVKKLDKKPSTKQLSLFS